MQYGSLCVALLEEGNLLAVGADVGEESVEPRERVEGDPGQVPAPEDAPAHEAQLLGVTLLLTLRVHAEHHVVAQEELEHEA